jgi:uncharacterized membrane protein (UPF0127 family)
VKVRRVEGWRDRLAGLALQPSTDEALYFPACRSVHTIGMRFALDLIWVDDEGHALRVDRDVPPLRVRSCRAAHGVIECPAGEADGLVATLDRSWLR